jgi:rhodanese-related sulfurtransferase
MNWIIIAITIAAIVGFIFLKRLAFVPAETASKHFAAGALVIDVRSPEEFRSGHVPSAINIPLGQLRKQLPQHVKEPKQPLLLHCLSGGRSAIAQQQLKRMGYANVFNLGSLARAQHLYALAKQEQLAAAADRGQS